jgi:hypothetical protein
VGEKDQRNRVLVISPPRFIKFDKTHLIFAVLGIESRALLVLGKCSNTEPHPSPNMIF